MANKQCVVKRDDLDNVTSVLVPNHMNPTLLQEAVRKNNNNPLSLTPDGNPSILYQTYVDMGLSAENSEKKVAEIYSQDFIDYFGDWIQDPENSSQVVDENGQPRIVYHGTSEEFDTFENQMMLSNGDVQDLNFFAERKGYSEKYKGAFIGMPGGYLMPVFLNIRRPDSSLLKPATITEAPPVFESKEERTKWRRDTVQTWTNSINSNSVMSVIENGTTSDGFRGYDSGTDEKVWVTTSPNQQKSAMQNSGEFSRTDNNIYRSTEVDRDIVDTPEEVQQGVVEQLEKKGLVSRVLNVSQEAMQKKLEKLGLSPEISRSISAWHGSPHKFDRFSTDFMSTGEGVQAFGWGLYFTDLKGIAKNYAKKLTPVQKYVRKLPKKIIEVKIDNDTDRIFSEKVLYTGDIYDKSILKDKLLDKIDSYSREMDLIDIKHDRARLTVDGNKATRNNIGYDGLREDFDIVLKYGYGPRSIADMSEDEKNEILEAMSKINNFFKNSYEKLLDNFDKYYIEDLQNTVQPEKPLTNLYNVSLHQGKDPSEYVWLNWYENVSQDIKTRLMPEILKANLKLGIKNNTENGILKENFTGQTLYTIFKDYFKSDKEASLFLLENGIDGVKYPAESISRGATSDTTRGFNYVVFDDAAITIDDVIQFNKTGIKTIPGGFYNQKTREIWLNQEAPDTMATAIHEFAHPMLQWLRQNRSDHFQAGVGIIRKNPTAVQSYIDQVEKLYPELDPDGLDFYEEVLATIIGNNGSDLVQSKSQSDIAKWLEEFWAMMQDILGITSYTPQQISQMTIREFSDAVTAEMLDGRNLNIREAEQYGFGRDFNTEKVARERFDISNLKKINAGSDRVVFELGDGKVLKVAKTARGLRQNEFEGDWPLVQDGILPQVFEEGLNYVVVEKVEPVKAKDVVPTYNEKGEVVGSEKFEQMNADLYRFSSMAFTNRNEDLIKVLKKYGLTSVLDYDILARDFSKKANWGMKDGKPIHLDCGTFGGHKMLDDYKGKTNLEDSDFRAIYEESRVSKKQFGDRDKYTMFSKSQNVKQNDMIPSKLFQDLMQQPFITPDQALEAYKKIYTDEVGDWQNSRLDC